ncbi:IS1380 family transposase [Thermodesulfobacteriota bacterium]
MIRQTVLPFMLEITRDTITSHAGLALLGEFCIGLDLLGVVDRDLPKPGSGAGYKASEYVFPLVLMFNGGGRSLEDMRVIRADTGLREVLPLERVPSSDAAGDWLRRMGEAGGLLGLERSNRGFLKRGMKYDGIKGYTLDIDATAIESHKESAFYTYKGYPGYMPIAGHLAENGLVVSEQFREGNEPPASRNLDFLKHCIKQMPKGKQIKRFRADAASYQADIINFCNKERIEFAIGADLDEAVFRAIASIAEPQWEPYKTGHIAETVHCMNRTREAFRLIVVRRPYQAKLFGDEDKKLRYTVIASNIAGKRQQVLKWYNQRGECSENRIKDLKIGFGMERMPCGQSHANAVFFRIGAIAYNVYRLFLMKTLDQSWNKHQVQTLRWRLYQTAGKVVNHSNRVSLKVRRGLYNLFAKIRLRIWEFANT